MVDEDIDPRALRILAETEDHLPVPGDPTYWDGLDEKAKDLGELFPELVVRYRDRLGNPISMRQWTILFGNRDYQVLKQENIGPYRVSTIWLGLDHGWGDVIQIFETMVFGPDTDYDQRRYSTEEQAFAGHEELATQLRLLVAANPEWEPNEDDEGYPPLDTDN